MSGRIFQNAVLQIKEAADRVIGVIDAEGSVISCSDLGLIGKKWPEYVEPINRAEGAILTLDGRTFRALSGWGSRFDYAVFTSASTVRGFARAVEGLDFSRVKAVCIGKQTKAAADALGMETYMADKATMESVVDCVERLCARAS